MSASAPAAVVGTSEADPPTTTHPPVAHSHDALPAGTRLCEFELLRVLGVGGFGIVYLALDHVLLRYVAIKEYLPAALASRGEGPQVVLRSQSHGETFSMGLRSFVNEARLLASFDHPSLVKVFRFWEAHGTAYMVMQYYAGRTLKEERTAMPGAPDETWLRGLAEPLLGALEVLHRQNVFHRDIAPDNILLLPDGRPLLLDFGAARRVIGERTQQLTAILKPAFAPIEQYADVAGMRQGPWTDIYAVGAVMHFMVTGHPPAPAVTRVVQDDLRTLAPARGQPAAAISDPFRLAIDWALAVKPQDRPQTVQALREALDGDRQPPPRSTPQRDKVEDDVADVERASDAAWSVTVRVPRLRREKGVAAAASPLRQRGAGKRHRHAVAATALLVVLTAGVWSQRDRTGNEPAPVARQAEQTLAPSEPPAVVANSPAPSALTVSAVVLPPASSASAPPRRRTQVAAPARKDVVPTQAMQASSAVQPVRIVAHSPMQSCADRGFFVQALCESRQCQLPRYRQHLRCLQLQRDIESRQQARMDR